MEEIVEALVKFRDDRRWQNYHTPRNLAESVTIEAAELLKCFQWDKDINHYNLADEIADIAIYLHYLCEHFSWRLNDLIWQKIAKNEVKYPLGKRHEW